MNTKEMVELPDMRIDNALVKIDVLAHKQRITLDSAECNLMMLALAILSIQRPGWDMMLGEFSDKLHGRAVYEELKKLNGSKQGANASVPDVAS